MKLELRPGDRVELVRLDDEFTDMEPGVQGVVQSVDALGTIHVAWDDGRMLGLIPGLDQWSILNEGEANDGE
jgi:hypothetical protein